VHSPFYYFVVNVLVIRHHAKIVENFGVRPNTEKSSAQEDFLITYFLFFLFFVIIKNLLVA